MLVRTIYRFWWFISKFWKFRTVLYLRLFFFLWLLQYTVCRFRLVRLKVNQIGILFLLLLHYRLVIKAWSCSISLVRPVPAPRSTQTFQQDRQVLESILQENWQQSHVKPLYFFSEGSWKFQVIHFHTWIFDQSTIPYIFAPNNFALPIRWYRLPCLTEKEKSLWSLVSLVKMAPTWQSCCFPRATQ